MTTITKTEKTAAIESLREMLKPGDTVYTVLRHVSASGMSRAIDVFTIQNGELVNLSWSVGRALGYIFDRNHGGLKVQGSGMDMGFEIAYNLGRTLFPEGFGVACSECGTRQPTEADATLQNGSLASPNGGACRYYGRNGDTSGWDNNGGYALNHRWI